MNQELATVELMPQPGSVNEDGFDDEPLALFHGDRGRLPLQARRALVLLLKSTYLSGDSYPEEWAALLEDEPLITSILNDLFLVPVIDVDSKIAYKIQAVSDGDDAFNTLLLDRPLTITEMRVLLHVRDLLARSRATGEERTIVDGSHLLDHLEAFYPSTQGDHIKARARDASALKALIKDGVLIPPHGEKDADPAKTTYTVSKVVETVLTPQRLEAFVAALQAEMPADLVTADAADNPRSNAVSTVEPEHPDLGLDREPHNAHGIDGEMPENATEAKKTRRRSAQNNQDEQQGIQPVGKSAQAPAPGVEPEFDLFSEEQ